MLKISFFNFRKIKYLRFFCSVQALFSLGVDTIKTDQKFQPCHLCGEKLPILRSLNSHRIRWSTTQGSWTWKACIYNAFGAEILKIFQLAGSDIQSALEMYKDRGQWDKCLEQAKKHSAQVRPPLPKYRNSILLLLKSVFQGLFALMAVNKAISRVDAWYAYFKEVRRSRLIILGHTFLVTNSGNRVRFRIRWVISG